MNQSILIVDDNIDNLDLTRLLLESEGFEVRQAEDAETALQILQIYRPGLILMDIQLPGMDGLELTRRLRQEPAAFEDVIIVALSAYAMKGDEDNALAAGCGGYITKPIDTRTFVGTVRGYLQALSPILSMVTSGKPRELIGSSMVRSER
jgi:two-component system cell cycle response regulator DivK